MALLNQLVLYIYIVVCKAKVHKEGGQEGFGSLGMLYSEYVSSLCAYTSSSPLSSIS